jgi:hypothetical protein
MAGSEVARLEVLEGPKRKVITIDISQSKIEVLVLPDGLEVEVGPGSGGRVGQAQSGLSLVPVDKVFHNGVLGYGGHSRSLCLCQGVNYRKGVVSEGIPGRGLQRGMIPGAEKWMSNKCLDEC